MKTAKEVREAMPTIGHQELMNEIEMLIEANASKGIGFMNYLVELQFTLADVDWVISELVANGYTVEQIECSSNFLTHLKIKW